MKIIVNKFLSPFGLDISQLNGFLDFVIGFLLVILPWFYVSENNIQSLVTLMSIGSALILYSIFTDYRHGLIKFVATQVHKALDTTLGVTLMALWPMQLTMTGVLLSFGGLLVLIGTFVL